MSKSLHTLSCLRHVSKTIETDLQRARREIEERRVKNRRKIDKQRRLKTENGSRTRFGSVEIMNEKGRVTRRVENKGKWGTNKPRSTGGEWRSPEGLVSSLRGRKENEEQSKGREDTKRRSDYMLCVYSFLSDRYKHIVEFFDKTCRRFWCVVRNL